MLDIIKRLTMLSNSYIADITNDVERTSRLSVLDGTDYISTMIGTFISAPLFKLFGYYVVFGTSGSLALIGVVYVLFFVRESIPKKSEVQSHITELQQNNPPVDYGTNNNLRNDFNELHDNTATVVTPPVDDPRCCIMCCGSNCHKSCRNVPGISDLISSFKVVVRSRSGWNRAMILM